MTSELSHPVQTITYSVPSLQYLIGFSNLACLKESSSSSSVLLLLQSSQFQINGSSLLLIAQTKNFGTSLHISSHPTLSLSKFCLQVDSEFDHILPLPPLTFCYYFFPGLKQLSLNQSCFCLAILQSTLNIVPVAVANLLLQRGIMSLLY